MLPIHAIERDILAALAAGNRLVLTAPTGSGKTTQAPQFMVRSGQFAGQIVCLQPRRLAARLVAKRVAREMDCPLGQLVGYQTRHESQVGRETRIRFVTEGLFLRQLQSNPELDGISAVILDEFHERNLASDVSLALVRQLQESARPDLRLIVMSATLDTQRVSLYLACPTLEAHGRTHPIQTIYLAQRPTRSRPRRLGSPTAIPPWELAADALADLLESHESGDVLIFMPGAYEIRRTIEQCQQLSTPAEPLAIFPLYSELPADQQDAALCPAVHRKVIVSTNVAETSITIEGIRHVIDSGLARVNRFDPRRGINVLMVEPISQASADQRAGRAGRTAPGTCRRLWLEADHRHRPRHTTPEVQRLDLAEVALQLLFLGIEPAAFPWLEPPDSLALEQALHVLGELGALDQRGLTKRGRVMARLPMHPRLSRMLIAAAELDCLKRAALWAALISERDILIRGQKHRFADDLLPGPRSDFAVLERAFETALAMRFDTSRCGAKGIHAIACREIDRTWKLYLDAAHSAHLTALSRRSGEAGSSRPSPGSVATIAKALLAAFPDHLALRRNPSNLACALTRNRRAQLDPESVAQHEGLLLPVEISEIGAGQNVKTVLSLVTEIDPDWLHAVHPDRIQHRNETVYNTDAQTVEAAERDLFEGLVIFEKLRPNPDPGDAARILAEQVSAGALKLDRWDYPVHQWIERTRCVAQWFPERRLITYDADEVAVILQEICAGATRYNQIKDRPCLQHVKDALSWSDQQFVERMAPERIELPRGWRMKIEYAAGQPPRGRAKIQDFYGLTQSPAVAGGRVPLLLEILAPNMRPVQVTDDLANFWTNLYPAVKKELSRRYPRHEWR